MDKPKKDPALLNQKQDYKLCLNCGFPNRNADTTCLYCNTSLIEDNGLFSWMKQTYHILRWRWQLKQRREHLNAPSVSKSSILKNAGFFVLGGVLSGIGVYVFSVAVAERSFANGLIAVLFFAYGFITLKSLLLKK